jgi:serine/threonine protein kinase
MSLPDRDQWKQLSPRLDSLLDLDAQARESRLVELRRDDAALAGELEVLLGAAARAEAALFLHGRVDDAMPGDDEPQPPGLAGRQVGAYVIEAPLGQGGAGSVWRARRADGRFEGAVAIKLLHLSLVGRSGARRFEREGAILARLVHPHIARLLDAGVTPDGQPYLVLELVEGRRIDHHCDALRLNVRQRLALFGKVLDAVAHAHNHLVIHRDIKPNNILVTGDGSVKLLDFGIAKLLQAESEETTVTAEGQRALTPEYAAPEQLQGAPVTTATDVYALGVLLYQLLAGRHPTAPGPASAAEVMRATLDTDPPRLATAVTLPPAEGAPAAPQVAADRDTSPARLRRQLEGDLENIVARTLRKSPAQRYQTVAALADDLRRHLAHEPVSARPDSLAYRAAKFVRRHRSQVAAASLVLLAVVAGLAGTVTQARRAEAQAQQARHERDNALRQLGYTRSSHEFITFLLREGSDKAFTTVELLTRAEPVLQKQFAGDPPQRAHLLLELAGLYVESTHLKKAEALLQQAQADVRDVPDPSLQARIECLRALLHGLDGAFDQARAGFDGAIARLRASPGFDRMPLSECLQFRGAIANIRGDTEAALADAQAGLATLDVPRPEERTLAISLHDDLATALAKLGRTAEGAAEYRRALAELEAMGRGRTRQASLVQQNFGVLLAKAGQALQAAEAYEKALDLERGLGGANPILQANYAHQLIELGRARDAMPLIEHALAEGAARKSGPVLTPIVALLGAPVWCAAGELRRCGELLSVARSGLTSVLPAGHVRLGMLELYQAQLSLARGDLPRARAELQRAVAIFDAARQKNQLRIPALALLARTEQQLGDGEAAQAHAGRAVAQAREHLAGFGHSTWLGTALAAQGRVQQARGDAAAAQASWRAALAELQATAGDSAPATLEVRRLLDGGAPAPAPRPLSRATPASSPE